MSWQRDKIRKLFLDNPNRDISLTIILDLRISQYGRVIKELRDDEKMKIVNHGIWENGIHKTWFRYETLIVEPTGQLCMVGAR